MAHKKNTTNLTELLLQYATQPDPMLRMLEWLCTELMEAEVDQQLGAEKGQRTDGRSDYRSGYRPRRLDTRMGTMYLMVPKVRQGGYIPFFVTERKRSEAMLVQTASSNVRKLKYTLSLLHLHAKKILFIIDVLVHCVILQYDRFTCIQSFRLITKVEGRNFFTEFLPSRAFLLYTSYAHWRRSCGGAAPAAP